MQTNREIIWAFIAILLITGLYLGVSSHSGSPASSGLFGHTIGIIGFLFMLATETLYSIRKRATGARWGRMQNWLQLHIFTGIVGPYFILLHSAFEFRGLAGIVTLLMVIVVLSGFVGRYIYTAVPRTTQGDILALEKMEAALSKVEGDIRNQFPNEAQALFDDLNASPSGSDILLSRVILRWQADQAWRGRLRKADREAREQMLRVDSLRRRRNDLVIQVHSAATARRVLSLWHSIHIPLGMALFVAAFVHIGAALYYATLIH